MPASEPQSFGSNTRAECEVQLAGAFAALRTHEPKAHATQVTSRTRYPQKLVDRIALGNLKGEQSWLKTSSVSVLSPGDSSGKPVIMMQPIQHRKRDDLGFSRFRWN
jgi:hypothetical protein